MAESESESLPVKLLIQIRDGALNDITPSEATIRVFNARPSEKPGATFDYDVPSPDIAAVLIRGFVELMERTASKVTPEDRRKVNEWLIATFDHAESVLLPLFAEPQ